jgi:hypothetical protein
MRFQSAASLRGLILALVVTTSLLVASGCGSQAMGFNNTLADLQKKLGEAQKKAEDTMEWPPDDPAKKKAASDNFLTTLADARKQFDELKVPQGDAAAKFHAAFNDYLKTQEDAGRMYKAWLDPSRKLAPEDMNRHREEMDKIRAKRNGLMQRLPYLQKAYAKEAGLTLKK